jgi:hypothetical protein
MCSPLNVNTVKSYPWRVSFIIPTCKERSQSIECVWCKRLSLTNITHHVFGDTVALLSLASGGGNFSAIEVSDCEAGATSIFASVEAWVYYEINYNWRKCRAPNRRKYALNYLNKYIVSDLQIWVQWYAELVRLVKSFLLVWGFVFIRHRGGRLWSFSVVRTTGEIPGNHWKLRLR